MTLPTARSTAEQYELRAREAESSSVPVLLKIARAFVWVMWAIVIASTIMLLLAFILRLFGANPTAPFAEWVYRSTESLMRPFRGIFPPHQINDTSIFDASLLFGALIYLMVALLFDGLLRWLEHKLRQQEQMTSSARAAADAAAQQLAQQEFALRLAAEHDRGGAQVAANEVWPTQQGSAVPPSQPDSPMPPPPTV